MKSIQTEQHIPKAYKQNTTTGRKIFDILTPVRKTKNKNFQSPVLEIDFLFVSRAGSNIIKIPTFNEIRTSHPRFSHVKP